MQAKALGKSTPVVHQRKVLGLPSLSAKSRTRNVIASAHVELADAFFNGLQHAAAHLPLAYEPVAAPCSLMKCGDVVHRSTLDLELRGEDGGLDWRGLLLIATVGAYLFVPPGPAPGFVDYYILRKLYQRQTITRDDVQLGRKVATGGFGSVFRGTVVKGGKKTDVIVKKAKEYGEAEVWMNERMMRADGGVHCAELLAAFDGDKDITNQGAYSSSPLDSDIWLVWRYEGDNTLYDCITQREFPYNLEAMLLGRELRLAKGAARKLVTIKLIMKQLLEALDACHKTGIVHRDVKPQNCIVCKTGTGGDKGGRIKLIDLGAAADLRIGINYVPKEYLLDPRYAPPQQYVMSTQTVRPPPLPVAAFLSPVLWRMESPDRFDMYSCGVTLLQMVFPSLRTDNAIIAFNKKLKDLRYDLREWRRQEESGRGMKPDMAEGFAMLDLDDGAGWELLCALMAYKPGDRPSAASALAHPFFGTVGALASLPQPLASSLTAMRSAGTVIASQGKFVEDVLMQTGKEGLLTEASLAQELGLEERAPVAARSASNTISWWQERRMELQKQAGKDGTTSTSAKAGAAGSNNGASPSMKKKLGGGPGKKSVDEEALAAAAIEAAAASGGSAAPQLPGWFGSSKVSIMAAAKAAAEGGSKKLNLGNGNGNGNGNGSSAPAPPRIQAAGKFSNGEVVAKPVAAKASGPKLPAWLGGLGALGAAKGAAAAAATPASSTDIEEEVEDEYEEEGEEEEEVEVKKPVAVGARFGGLKLPWGR